MYDIMFTKYIEQEIQEAAFVNLYMAGHGDNVVEAGMEEGT